MQQTAAPQTTDRTVALRLRCLDRKSRIGWTQRGLRDLVVRIGGYCDYYTRLPAAMQEELILRTEYGGLGAG